MIRDATEPAKSPGGAGGVSLHRRLPAPVRALLSPTYLAAIFVILFFAYWASGSPASFFALSLVFASIYIMLALAWDFSSGLTGYLNFGLPFFFGIGALAAGYLTYHGSLYVWETLLFAFGVGLVCGLLFSLPTLRLRGPYFTLLSLLLPLIGLDFLVAFWARLGLPTEGYEFLPFLSKFWAPFHLPWPYLATSPGGELVLLSMVNIAILTAFFLLRGSHFGLILRGIRDDEDALASQGIWTFPYKVVAFTLSSGIVAFAGASYALTNTFAGPDAFGFTFILFPVLIVILGGMGELAGSVVAGYFVILLLQYETPVFSTLTLVVFSFVAIALVLFLPGGLLRPIRAFVRFMRTGEPG